MLAKSSFQKNVFAAAFVVGLQQREYHPTENLLF
jgi:hypothetical protein